MVVDWCCKGGGGDSWVYIFTSTSVYNIGLGFIFSHRYTAVAKICEKMYV